MSTFHIAALGFIGTAASGWCFTWFADEWGVRFQAECREYLAVVLVPYAAVLAFWAAVLYMP